MAMTEGAAAPSRTPDERSSAAFVLSSVVGLLIVLSGAAMAVSFPLSGGPYYGGVMGGYYGMTHGFGLEGGWSYVMAAVGQSLESSS